MEHFEFIMEWELDYDGIILFGFVGGTEWNHSHPLFIMRSDREQ